jgi:hypothetical protein
MDKEGPFGELDEMMKRMDEIVRTFLGKIPDTTTTTFFSPQEALVNLNEELKSAIQKGDVEKAKCITKAFELVPKNDLRAALNPIDKDVRAVGIKFIDSFLKTASYHDNLEVLRHTKMLFEAFQVGEEEGKKLLKERILWVVGNEGLDPDDKMAFIKEAKEYF